MRKWFSSLRPFNQRPNNRITELFGNRKKYYLKILCMCSKWQTCSLEGSLCQIKWYRLHNCTWLWNLVTTVTTTLFFPSRCLWLWYRLYRRRLLSSRDRPPGAGQHWGRGSDWHQCRRGQTTSGVRSRFRGLGQTDLPLLPVQCMELFLVSWTLR